MKKYIKSVVSNLLSITVKHRLVHCQRSLDSVKDVWAQLQKSGFRPNTILDVGAARGEWTQEIFELFPNAEFLLIEPLIENEQRLQLLQEKNSKIQYWLGAVGNTSGEIEIHVHSDQSSFFASEWGGKKRIVPIRQLDSFLEDGTIVSMDALKIDVQGSELSVLKGAEKLLENCKVIQVEVSFRQIYDKAPLTHEIVSFFARKNYRIYDICDAVKREQDRALIQADLFFVSEKKYFKPETFTIY